MGAAERFYLAEGLGSPLCLTFVSVLTHREQAGHHASVQGDVHRGHFVSPSGARQFLVENKYSLQFLFCPSLFFLYLDNYFNTI